MIDIYLRLPLPKCNQILIIFLLCIPCVFPCWVVLMALSDLKNTWGILIRITCKRITRGVINFRLNRYGGHTLILKSTVYYNIKLKCIFSSPGRSPQSSKWSWPQNFQRNKFLFSVFKIRVQGCFKRVSCETIYWVEFNLCLTFLFA